MAEHTSIWFLSDIPRMIRQSIWPVYVPPAPILTGAYGWLAGGQNVGSYSSTVFRYEYASDTTNAASRSALTLSRCFIAPVSNGTFSWYSGGYDLSMYNLIDRIDHANDTTNAVDRCDRTIATYGASGVSNGTNGWFLGGNQPAGNGGVNVIDRITYATDTADAIDRADLDATGSYARHTALTNGTFGYIAGGDQGPLFATLSVDRMSFASDTSNAILRNGLTISRSMLASAANATHGWFAGGGRDAPFSNVVVNIVDRIDFSNDTTAIADRCDLSVARAGLTGMTNGTYGWFSSGKDITSVSLNPGTTVYGNIDRVDFANDTANAVSRASGATRADICSVQNSSAAY